MELVFYCYATEDFDRLKESLDNTELNNDFEYSYKSCFLFDVEDEEIVKVKTVINSICERRKINGHFREVK